MATDAAERLTEITRNSTPVIVRVAFRAGPPKPQPSFYVDLGRRIEVNPPDASSPDACGVSTAWGGGTVSLAVSDATQASADACTQAKRLLTIVAGKLPG